MRPAASLVLLTVLSDCTATKNYSGDYRVTIENETETYYSCGTITIEALGNGTETVALSDVRDVYPITDPKGNTEYHAIALGRKVFVGVHEVKLEELTATNESHNPCKLQPSK